MAAAPLLNGCNVTLLFRLIFRVLRLFADSREKFADTGRADGIGEESRADDPAVGKNGIGRARFTLSSRLKQPGTLTYFYPKNAGLRSWSMFVGRFPAIEIGQSIFNRPRFFLDPKRVIPIADDLWRDPLISENGIAVSLDDAALCRVGHETRISLDVIDDLMNCLGRYIDFAYGLELL